jgi:hypothetical protein
VTASMSADGSVPSVDCNPPHSPNHSLNSLDALFCCSVLRTGWRAHLDWRWLRANIATVERSIEQRNMPLLKAVPAKLSQLHEEWVKLDKELTAVWPSTA